MIHHWQQALIATADGQTIPPLVEAVRGLVLKIVGTARTGGEVLEQISTFQPDLLIADLILPGIDGVQLAQDLLDLSLNRYPAVILLDPAGCAPVVPDWLTTCGVAILPKPATAAMLSQAVESLVPERRKLPPARHTKLIQTLDALGVPDHPGRLYLSDATTLAWMDSVYLSNMKRRLYPAVAQKNSTDAARVERAMRYAIDAAWRTGDIGHQHRIFGDTIDARRGKPTSGEMIARLADILRWEGRE